MLVVSTDVANFISYAGRMQTHYVQLELFFTQLHESLKSYGASVSSTDPN